MLTFKKKVFNMGIFAVLFFVLGISVVMAWEAPIQIAAKDNHQYNTPETAFGPSGTVYIVYREKSLATRDSDIMLCTYDGKELKYENVSELALKWDSYDGYFCDVAVDANERVHVVWAGLNRLNPANHIIMYRYKQGDQWSPIIDIGTIPMTSSEEELEDVRLAVDNNGNAHFVTFRIMAKDIWYGARYGETIVPMKILPTNYGKSEKHPDVAVDDDYVHVVWMRKVGWPYAIMYQKWENKLGGTIGPITQVTFPAQPYANQKSRVRLDGEGTPHHAVFQKHESGSKWLKYYKSNPDGTLPRSYLVSHPSNMMLYHLANIAVRVDSTANSILCAMQLGQSKGGTGVWYSWQRNGIWGPYSLVPNSNGVKHLSVDLSWDGIVAAAVFNEFENRVILIPSEPITASGRLEAQFTNPDRIFWGSDVTFDATECDSLNPDHNIVSYEWDFGYGNIVTTTVPAVSHNFDAYGTYVKVTLKIIADTGQEGTFEKDIYIHALYNGIITNIEKMQIRTLFFNRPAYEIQWTDNPKNAAAGYPAVTRYEIWRVPVGSAAYENAYVLIAEVDASVTRFLDYQGVQDNVNYIYSIRSVDAEGHISPFDNE